jgi:hypothetical protein
VKLVSSILMHQGSTHDKFVVNASPEIVAVHAVCVAIGVAVTGAVGDRCSAKLAVGGGMGHGGASNNSGHDVTVICTPLVEILPAGKANVGY